MDRVVWGADPTLTELSLQLSTVDPTAAQQVKAEATRICSFLC